MLTTVTSFALMDSLFAFNAFQKPIRPITEHWVHNLHEYCSDLRQQEITPFEWQEKIEQLFNKIELAELLEFIDFDSLRKGFQFPELGVNTKPIVFPKLTGLPSKTVFVKKIFGMKKGRAIIPHGHSNMASAHLVLQGEMHLRHYEKVRKEDQNLVIKPTIDRTATIGQCSSISDEKDNIHWFVSNSETAFTFDVIMLDLNGKQYDIHNLDIYRKEDLSDGTMRVPILDVETALKKYGKETHH